MTFTVGSGSTAQPCDTGQTDQNGVASCRSLVVNQPASSEPITVSFGGDSYDTPATPVNPITLSVTEPTMLTVNPCSTTAGGDYSD